MANANAPLKFDHKEVVVLFSLFVFTSLFMFTVGIVVGKSLAQAKYDGGASSPAAAHPGEDSHGKAEAVEVKSAHGKEKGHEEKSDHKPASLDHKDAPPSPHSEEPAKALEPEKKTPPHHAPPPSLELVPKKAKNDDLHGQTWRENAGRKAAEEAMKNPKIKALVEDGPLEVPKKKEAAAAKATPPSPSSKGLPPSPSDRAPASLGQGAYRVQVASYPNEKDAKQRVESLKKLGFPHAYFSAKNWPQSQDIWYRVWLGHFASFDEAKLGGDFLQKQGEVKNYLIRKEDEPDSP